MKGSGVGSVLMGIAATVGAFDAPNGPAVCSVTDLATLNACVRHHSQPQPLTLRFLADIECADAACCPGDALVILDNSSNISLEGNHHTLVRHSDHRKCNAISGRNTAHIRIEDLTIDDDATAPPCSPDDQPCAPSLYFSNAANIEIRNVRVYNARGFAISAAGVDGFVFARSAVVNAGMIGLYVSSASTGSPSNHVQVLDSVFAQSRTNAICLDGVKGSQRTDNVIAGNVVTQNHLHGLYLDANKKPYDGGQIYLPDLVNATIHDNIIGLGFCGNCDNSMVWGFELGPKTLSSVSFVSNIVFDNHGVAFFKNTGLTLDSSDLIENTTVYDSSGLTLGGAENALGPARLSMNTVVGSAAPAADRGNPAYAIFRQRHAGHHVAGEIEAAFALSPVPRMGAPMGPILGCTMAGDRDGSRGTEFASISRHCENQNIRRVLGYSYEATYPGAMAVYRCRSGEKRFVSGDAQCEGQLFEQQIGYALPTAFFHSRASARE